MLLTHVRTRLTVGNISDLGLVWPPRAALAVATNLHRARGGAVFLREAALG